MKRLIAGTALAAAAGSLYLMPLPAAAQHKFVVKPVAQKKVGQLPAGTLYWRIENFPTLAQAQAAADAKHWNPDTVSNEPNASLAAEVDGKAWLFTLGPKGGASPGATEVAEIGPVPRISAHEYLLRINSTGGPPGVKTPVHVHPGSETFYVLSGRLGQKTPGGVSYVEAGQSMLGHAANTPMEVFSSGKTDLHALVMFVVDAGKPFSTRATMTAH
jgi:quercetin dioxygenase-like cupin family protein